MHTPASPGAGDPGARSRQDLFISYSRRDGEFVRELVAVLESRGKSVWVDQVDIPPAARWRQELTAAIEAADTFVAVISPDWVGSPHCRHELDHAAAAGKRIIPVLRREAEDVPEELASRQYVFMRERDEQDAALDALVRALDTDLEWVRGHTRWLEEAVRWEAANRDRGLLLRGSDLKGAEAWLVTGAGRSEPRPTPLQVELVQASRRGTTRRLQLVVGATAAALVVSIALGVFALIQRNQAIARERTARAGQLAAAATAQLTVDPERSLLLAARAVDTQPTREAQATLRQAIFDSLLRQTFRGHTDEVYDVAVSPDGRQVASTSKDATVRVWTLGDGAAPVVLTGDVPLAGIAFTPDGRELITPRFDGVIVWDLASATVRQRLPVAEILAGSVAVSRDGVIAIGTRQGAVGIWPLTHRAEPLLLRAHEGRVAAMAFTPDGRLVSGGGDGTVRLWPADRGPATVVARHEVHDVAVNPDGRYVAGGDAAGTVRVWDLAGAAPPVVLRGHDKDAMAVAFSPDGRWIVSGGADGTIRVWDWRRRTASAVLRGHQGFVWSVAFTPDGKRIVSGGADTTVRVWEWSGDRAPLAGSGRTGRKTAAGFTPDGRTAVAVDQRGIVRTWDLDSGEAPSVWRGHRGRLAVLSRDRRTVANLANGQVQVWPWADPGARWIVGTAQPMAEVFGLSLLPDGRHVAVGFEAAGGAIWPGPGDLPQETLLVEEADQILLAIAASPDGRLVAAGSSNGGVLVWDRQSRAFRPRGLAGHRGFVWATSFSPDGRHLVTGGDDGTVRVWDVASGRAEAVMRGHDGRVITAEFSPDGRWVVSGGQDATVRVWDWTGTLTAVAMRGHRGLVAAATFSPDGRAVLSASHDGDVRIWRCEVCVPIEEMRTLARTRVTRDLSREELDALAP